MNANAGFDSTTDPTIINIKNAIDSSTIDITESHKVYVFTVQAAAANESILDYTVNWKINPCFTAIIETPTPFPMTVNLYTGNTFTSIILPFTTKTVYSDIDENCGPLTYTLTESTNTLLPYSSAIE